MQSIVFATVLLFAGSCFASPPYGAPSAVYPGPAPAPGYAAPSYAAPSYAAPSYAAPAYAAPAPALAPAPVYGHRILSYPSPAPSVQCGSNLLVGCAPNVAQVPCSASPAYGAAAPSYGGRIGY